jgi:hypothetical protein
LGEFGAQAGNVLENPNADFNLNTMFGAGFATAGAYAFLGEGLLASVAKSQGQDLPALTDMVQSLNTDLWSTALTPAASAGLNSLERDLQSLPWGAAGK